MENAAKALLIAGGILIAILLIALIRFAWGKYSDYQNSKYELIEIEDVAKFNEQFSNYDRSNVQGYELLTLINQVVDYNERRTTNSVWGNDEKYNSIGIKVNFLNANNINSLAYDKKAVLFNESKPNYEEDDLTINGRTKTSKSFKVQIEDKITNLVNSTFGGNEETAKLVAKNIGQIFLTETEIENKAGGSGASDEDKTKIKIQMVTLYNSCFPSGNGPLDPKSDTDRKKLILRNNKRETIVSSAGSLNSEYSAACRYYEWMQFKRSEFKCVNLEYDLNTKRVKQIDFEFVRIR